MDQAAYFVLASLLPLWIICLFLFSRASWNRLARFYKSDVVFHGNNYGKFNARINDLNYAARLYLQYNEEGIYLSVVKVYRLFHPPLFIPWNEITEIRKTEKDVVIVVGIDPDSTEIQINHQTFEKLEKTLVQYRDQVTAQF